VTSLPVTTAVTCPTFRVHPAVIAQAAATASLLTGGRFTLGVGTGEQLTHRGKYYEVDTARLYSVPEVPPSIGTNTFATIVL
jgi:alkanesulfonate monooxygenase SsuD/methylene tetrahydromethanopterin reductase-like flavin-dependent oxidoreductase (luciferase family)